MSTNVIDDLKVAELTALLAPLQGSLATIAKGDGSIQSLTGQGLILEAEYIAALPTLQKIGVNVLAGDLNQKITDWLASQVSSATPATLASPATAGSGS